MCFEMETVVALAMIRMVCLSVMEAPDGCTYSYPFISTHLMHLGTRGVGHMVEYTATRQLGDKCGSMSSGGVI